MPSFADCKEILIDNFTNPETQEKAVLITGEPGCAKTSMGKAIAPDLDVPPDHVKVIHPPRVNPINYMGMPKGVDGMMVWDEPADLHEMSTGRWVLVIDELAKCGPMMQATMGGLMLDRAVNKVRLSKDVFIIATGNRVQDKAGAKAVMTDTGNRVMSLTMEYTHTDFISYGIDAGLDPIGLAFIQFAPRHMQDFDPNRTINATARSWEFALKVNTNLRSDLYLAALSGIIPAGIAAEYHGFRQIVARLPNPEEVRKNPDTAAIPHDLDVIYALIANLLVNTQTAQEFDHIMRYVGRLPVEFQTLYVHTCIKRVPMANQSPVYIQWIQKNQSFLGAGAVR